MVDAATDLPVAAHDGQDGRSGTSAALGEQDAPDAAVGVSDAAGHGRSVGAQLRNRNSIRHGLRSGTLPKGAAYVKREVDEMRRAIERAVSDRNSGEISLYHAALIQSAMRWERHALLAQRWLRLGQDEMDWAARLHYSREIAKASAERDRALKELGLDRQGEQGRLIDALYVDCEPKGTTTEDEQ